MRLNSEIDDRPDLSQLAIKSDSRRILLACDCNGDNKDKKLLVTPLFNANEDAIKLDCSLPKTIKWKNTLTSVLAKIL